MPNYYQVCISDQTVDRMASVINVPEQYIVRLTKYYYTQLIQCIIYYIVEPILESISIRKWWKTYYYMYMIGYECQTIVLRFYTYVGLYIHVGDNKLDDHVDISFQRSSIIYIKATLSQFVIIISLTYQINTLCVRQTPGMLEMIDKKGHMELWSLQRCSNWIDNQSVYIHGSIFSQLN